MNTNPTTQRAADVIAEFFGPHDSPLDAARALAAAGLLADPTTPQPTDEQRIVAAFNELQPCPTDSVTDYWRGYADGWNSTQTWVKRRAAELAEADRQATK